MVGCCFSSPASTVPTRAPPPGTRARPRPTPPPCLPQEGDSADTADTGAPGTDAPELVPPLREGDCAVDTAGAPALIYRDLLPEGASYGYSDLLGLPEGPSAAVLATEDEYQAWLDQAGLPLDPSDVDFETELVVALSHRTFSTCSIHTGERGVVDVAGTPHVSMSVVDTSYACDVVCWLVEGLVWVVAVPRGASGTATACLSVGGGCGALP